jgi:SAM-dependent methyltransferase
LNRVKLYLAANLINPLIMPFVLFAEVQIGSWMRRGHGYPISMNAFATLNPWHFGLDLFVGSVILGCALGGVVGGLTFATLGRTLRDPVFSALVKVASDRYLGSGITAWEFARAKLRNDPVYRQVVTTGLVAPGSRVMDVGCGQGLLLAILAAARDAAEQGSWPADWAPAPRGAALIGVELRPRIAQIAREALADAAEIHLADARTLVASEETRADTIVLFDVLHLMTADDQERLLRVLIDALPSGGRLLVREADASGGWRFKFVRLGNRLTAWTQRRWTPTFHFRRAADWRALLEGFGLQVEDPREMGTASFANVLLVAIKPR